MSTGDLVPFRILLWRCGTLWWGAVTRGRHVPFYFSANSVQLCGAQFASKPPFNYSLLPASKPPFNYCIFWLFFFSICQHNRALFRNLKSGVSKKFLNISNGVLVRFMHCFHISAVIRYEGLWSHLPLLAPFT